MVMPLYAMQKSSPVINLSDFNEELIIEVIACEATIAIPNKHLIIIR
jgi:hypothetical protein